MSEKLDLDALERVLIGSAMGLTFRECQTLIKYARALESRASNAGGVHPDHLVLLKPFMSERDGLLTHSLTVYLREMADPEFAERMHKARARLYTATNAGGAVHQVLDVDTCSWHDVTPDYYAERLPSNRRVLYTHPAPASKEPVADERAPLPAVSNTLAGFRGGWIAVNGHPPLDQDIWNAGVRSGMTRATLATAQTPEVQKRLDEYVRLRDGTGGCTDGGCVIKRPTGMHTNGGCKCSHDKYKAMRMMYAGQQLADALLATAPAKPEGV
jgi:hypothetical protein